MGDQHATDVLTEIVALAEDPNQTLEQVSGQLEALYGRAEDKQDQHGMALVSTVYDGVIKLHRQMGTAVNIAVAAREIAGALMEQRDQALEELKQVGDMNPDHPMVQDTIEMAHEGFQEEIYSSGAYISGDPAYDIIEEAGIPCSYEVAMMFHDLITSYCSMDGMTETPLEIRQEIADFMAKIVKKAQDALIPVPVGEGRKNGTNDERD